MAVSTIKGAKYETLSASDFMTFESGFGAIGDKIFIVRDGNVISGRFILALSSSISADQQKQIGTIKAQYRPRNMGSVGGVAYYGLIADTGVVYIKPHTAKTASATETVLFTYII